MKSLASRATEGISIALWLFPRPWLTPSVGQTHNAALVECGDAEPLIADEVYRSASGRIYVKGEIRRDGQVIRFAPYWHQLALFSDGN